MRAAERLVAEGGMENLSIKEIIAVAGQKMSPPCNITLRT
jgi:hypothetical protein